MDPPPSGLHPDSATDVAGATGEDWHGRYEEQHKRTRLFMATTAAAVAALLGTLFFAVAQGGAVGSAALTPAGIGSDSGQVQGPGGHGPMGGPPGLDDHHDDDDGFEQFDDD